MTQNNRVQVVSYRSLALESNWIKIVSRQILWYWQHQIVIQLINVISHCDEVCESHPELKCPTFQQESTYLQPDTEKPRARSHIHDNLVNFYVSDQVKVTKTHKSMYKSVVFLPFNQICFYPTNPGPSGLALASEGDGSFNPKWKLKPNVTHLSLIMTL